MNDETSRVEYHLTIKDLPQEERPRERLEHYGAENLSKAELIAILLRSGVRGESVLQLAQRLLVKYGDLAGLERASFAELEQEKGLGPAKVTQLKAALELGKRLQKEQVWDRTQIRSPKDVANLLMLDMGLLEQEHLRVLLLDTRNRLLATHNLYVGNLNSSVVRVGEIFREAIKANSAAIIVAHNHPSGDPTPSSQDVAVTEQIVRAGQLLNIDVLDHLIICRNRFVSLKERGQGFG